MTMDATTLFARLALRPDASERDVRRAYAVELKKIDQELQPAAFQQLRETYDALLGWLQRQKMAQQAQELRQHDEAQASAPVVAEPDVTPRTHATSQVQTPSKTAQTAPPQECPVSHEALAREMLQMLVRRFETRPFTDHHACAAFLAQSLDDPRLAQVDARQYFEWGIASILASGWRSGHELLFAPAMECFGWRQDRTRLLWLGRPGQVLDAAIAELTVFDGQPGADRHVQRDVIRALRGAVRRSSSELVKELPIAEFLVANFPNWLHVISQPQTLLAWRASHAKVPGWRRKLVLPVKAASIKPNREPANGAFGMIFLVLLAVGALSKLTVGQPPMATDAYRDANATAFVNQVLAPSPSYGARVTARIKPNITYSQLLPGNPVAEIEVRSAPDGTIVSRRLVKSSGVQSWDAATLNAVDKTRELPQDVNGQVPPVLVISFRPKD